MPIKLFELQFFPMAVSIDDKITRLFTSLQNIVLKTHNEIKT